MRIHNLATTKRTRRRLESANRSPSFESVQATVRSLWDVVEAADDSAQGKIKREISDTINRLKSRVEISLVIVQFPCAMNHPCSSKQLANLREAGTLRRIKRFANALMDGVPVRDKDRPGSDVDLLDWLRQCRRAGLYDQGKAIYEKGDLNLAKLTDDQQIEANDDYRICVRRGGSQESQPKRQRRREQAAEE